MYLEKKIVTKIAGVVQHSDPDKFEKFLPCLQGNESRTPVLGEVACTKSEITGLFMRGA